LGLPIERRNIPSSMRRRARRDGTAAVPLIEIEVSVASFFGKNELTK
jgi:hypothetical protein